MEKKLWENLGIPATPLRDRPWKEVRDYLIIIAALDREQAAQAQRR